MGGSGGNTRAFCDYSKRRNYLKPTTQYSTGLDKVAPYQFPEVTLSGTKVFAMRNRNTGLMTTIDTSAIRNFVIFPLPRNDPEYSDYMAQLRKRIPSADLRVLAQSGNDYAFGPVDDLHCLFPRTAAVALSRETQ